MSFAHKPVLYEETISSLNVQPGGIYVDCTLGGGGHSAGLIANSGPNGLVIGIDTDREAIKAATQALRTYGNRFLAVEGNFRRLDEILTRLRIAAVDGFLFDLGVSSHQFDTPERGFSYRHDAPLDMRMDRRQKTTAYHLVNGLTAGELADIIRRYGEERWAQRIADFIVEYRQKKPIETTGELVEIIKSAIPASARRTGPHPARRTFQALRIAVNDELGAIEEAIDKAVEFLRPGGRIAVITFHSLEDRIVKRAFQSMHRGCTCPPELPVCVCGKSPRARLVNRKPITPSNQEVLENPRARSAKLRVMEKLRV